MCAVFGFPLDAVYSPLFVICAITFISRIKIKWIPNVLIFLAKHSTWIWFMHGIFFIGNAQIQKVAYWPHFSLLILIWVLIVCVMISVVLQISGKKLRRFLHENKKSTNK